MRVLIVEENPGFRNLVCCELRDAGHTAEEAGGWQEGIRAALQDPPDAVVVNGTILPKEGAKFIRILREAPSLRDLPVVGIAFALGAERELLDAGVDCCLRAIPTRGDILKAVSWAISVYRERGDR